MPSIEDQIWKWENLLRLRLIQVIVDYWELLGSRYGGSQSRTLFSVSEISERKPQRRTAETLPAPAFLAKMKTIRPGFFKKHVLWQGIVFV